MAYFLEHYTIPATAFGLRFNDTERRGLEEAVTQAIPRFKQRTGQSPACVVVPRPVEVATVAGLPVKVDSRMLAREFELR